MKNFIILGVLVLFVFIAAPVLAGGSIHHNKTVDSFKAGVFDNKVIIKDNLNDNQVGLVNQKGSGNQQGLINQKGNKNQTGLVNQSGHHNTQVVGGAGMYEGGDAQSQSVDNKNVNKNIGNVKNSGNSKQQQSANNEGVSLTVKQNFEDKRDHITGPNVLQSDAKLSSGRAFSAKVQGAKAFFSNVSEMTRKQAKKLASKASDITCEEALLMENDFATDRIKCTYFGKQLPGQYMGYLYMGSDGDDINTLAMIGEAGDEAMEAGATHMRLVFMESGEMAEGDSWNIGLGGGASIMSGGAERLAVAPNGGLGIGHADAFNELRPEMVFELTFDKALTSNYKLSKATHGWDANLIEDNQVR